MKKLSDKIRTLLSRTSGNSALPAAPYAAIPTGYFPPGNAEELVSSPLRQDALQKIRQNNSLPAEVYQRLYLTPVYILLKRIQNVPAATEGRWACTGGLGDLSLLFTAYTVRLARGYMFPPGAAPEEQASQGGIWQAVIFWSALCYHLPLLASLEGETIDGIRWQPGISIPDGPYRFRFRSAPPAAQEASSLATLVASQLIPAEAISWLSAIPDALFTLADAFRNGSPEMPLIRTLLEQAAEKVDSPMTETLQGSVVPKNDESLIKTDSTAVDLVTSLNSTENIGILQSLLNEEKMAEPQEKTNNNHPLHVDTDILLNLFSDAEVIDKADSAFTETTDEVEITGKEIAIDFTTVNQSDTSADTRQPGEQFLSWLTEGMASGNISINQHNSRLHFVAGFYYLLVPDIFYLFIKETASEYDRELLQSSFEKLQLHRVSKGKRFIRAKLYISEEKNGKFSKINGYLIRAGRLTRDISPEDSKYLFFS
ncbi:TraI domain-containing protein [Enterobacteriaceae bacterium ESL0689]|nr:TraI domain-containing protein [Enterobacteriaceae bacterium ESL0689]